MIMAQFSVDSIHIDVRIPPALQRTVPPVLNMDIRFLVQFTDGRRRYFAAPQGLSDILRTPDRYPCQIYLNESFFNAAFTATVPFNDGGFRRNSLEFGHFQGNIPGSGGEIAVVVSATVALALFVTFVAGCLSKLVCLGIQQLVESFLYAASHKFFEFALDYSLI